MLLALLLLNTAGLLALGVAVVALWRRRPVVNVSNAVVGFDTAQVVTRALGDARRRGLASHYDLARAAAFGGVALAAAKGTTP